MALPSWAEVACGQTYAAIRLNEYGEVEVMSTNGAPEWTRFHAPPAAQRETHGRRIPSETVAYMPASAHAPLDGRQP